MNVLLYYPRLIAALVLRRPPRCHATLQHWVNAQLFWLWNHPWDNPLDTFGMSVVRLYALAKKSSFAPWHWKARLASFIFRVVFLCLLFAWPILTAFKAFRSQGRRLARWNSLVNQLRIFFSESWSHGTARRRAIGLHGLSRAAALYLPTTQAAEFPTAKMKPSTFVAGWAFPHRECSPLTTCQHRGKPTS